MNEHLKPEHSMALMALAADDPERLAAERHAATCPACRAMLEEGQTLLGWVDTFGNLPGVAPALKERVRKVVLSPDATPASAASKWLLSLGMLVSGLLAWFDGVPGELSPARGAHCIAYENMIAVAPFAVAAWLGLRGVVALKPMNLAVVSMAGAIVGQLLLHTRCESHATPHLFGFHVVGVALAAGLGYAATTGLVRVRARSH